MINNRTLFQISILIILIFFIFTYLFPNDYANVIILITFSGIIAYFYVQYKKTDLSDRNQIIMNHLMSLQETVNKFIDKNLSEKNKLSSKLSSKEINQIYKNNTLDSLYIDSNMIEFLYSIINLYQYNNSEFYLLLKGTNNILKLRNEIETYYNANKVYPDNINQMMEIAILLRSKTINNMHNFIYSIPKTNMMYNYINSLIHRYMILISRNTDKIYEYVLENRKQKGINTDSNLALSYNNIKPYDNQNNDFYV